MARIVLIEMSPSGGLFQFGFQLGTRLAGEGHEVELVTGPDPELTPREPGLRISSILPTWHARPRGVEPSWLRKLRRVWRALRHALALVRILRHVRATQPDAIFWHPLRFTIDAWLVSACRRVSPGTAFCMVLHEARPLAEGRRDGSLYREESLGDRTLHRALGRAMGTLDLVFVLGEKARAEAREQWQLRCPVVVIPHGDEGVFLAGEPVPAVEATEPVVLFFGIWTRHKGLSVLFDAFAAVRDAVPQARLVVAGAVQGDVDFDEVRVHAGRVPGIELRPGYVDMGEVPGLFGQARVVVAPYLRGNQSGVVHLAQTFGRPVVASDVGDIPSAVPHRQAGLIVAPNDVAALAGALEELLTDAELAGKLGRAGQERVSTQGSWAEIAKVVSKSLADVRSETRRS